MLIVNFKAYAEASGARAVRLAKICDKVARKTGASIAVAVQPSDILAVASQVGIPVLAQHVDAVEPGAHTGAILAESIQEAGAIGSLLNHSERPMDLKDLAKAIKRLRKLDLVSVVCASSPAKEAKIAKLKPDILAIEPPELIGGKVSVSKAKPQLIEIAVKRAKNIPVLCGAGVHTTTDVATAVALGAKGVLVASGVVKAKNVEKELLALVRGL